MEKISFKNSEGLNLIGLLHTPAKPADAVVVICHGFTSNKDRPRHQKLADALAKEGIAAFRFDFGASGESGDREITVHAEVDDLKSAIACMRERGYRRIGLMGESLGGLVALEAYDDGIKAVAFWAPVTKSLNSNILSEEQTKSLEENGYYIREKDGKRFKIPREYREERLNVDRASLLGNVKIPVLIVHGTADVALPIADSEEAIKLLPEGSRLEAIEEWEHGDVKMEEQMDVIVPKTAAWFKEHLD